MYWKELREYGHHACFEKDPLSHFKRLQMGIFGFWQKEAGAKSVVLTMTQRVSSCFFCEKEKKLAPIYYVKKHLDIKILIVKFWVTV